MPLEVDPATDCRDGRSKIALLRPEAIRLDQAPAPVVTGRNRITGRVVVGMHLGPRVEYIVEVGEDRLRAYSRAALAPGSPAIHDCRLVDDMPQTEVMSRHA
ncbi:MAG: TOBE domain-containing protein [Bradyrhizobium sp.]|uniref:TOBE domain-containing protein n=1 Tax=Bradyrhizobium sp. TaxID=376 RepID=UPI001E12874A|nr:TOBE domain-containing protein [Bradyrhizobium sp.]MBV9566129.1 TOBE domain-containing protein [Bradyrhizobium sp.]